MNTIKYVKLVIALLCCYVAIGAVIMPNVFASNYEDEVARLSAYIEDHNAASATTTRVNPAIVEGAPVDVEAALNVNAVSNDVAFIIDDNDLVTQYGDYLETEVELAKPVTGPVIWQVINSTLPPGLELEENATGNKILIFGTPQFTGTWCFTLLADTQSPDTGGADEICFTSADNPSLTYPKFLTGSYLDQAVTNRFYQKQIDFSVPDGVTYTGEVLDTLPDGFEVILNDYDKNFLIKGRFPASGLVRFSLKVTDDQSRENSQQFNLAIEDEENNYSCPPGYYFDEDLRYCVADTPTQCPPGTFFDPNTGSCVAYQPPPQGYYCPPGTYYDQYLDRCVREAYPRCPWDYRWDEYANRCVREAYSCPYGYRYNWRWQECVLVFHGRDYGPGRHYDYYYGCVSNNRRCPPGWFWDHRHDRCERADRPGHCHNGEVWDPRRGRCISRSDICGPGTFYDPNTRRCIARERRCPPGQHWEGNHCVNNSHPMPMPMPGPGPEPMPMPMPGPGPEPMPMPMGMGNVDEVTPLSTTPEASPLLLPGNQ